ncbi:MAG: hypothetical protein ACKVTZ_06975 [Bacteroidia bacterium]
MKGLIYACIFLCILKGYWVDAINVRNMEKREQTQRDYQPSDSVGASFIEKRNITVEKYVNLDSINATYLKISTYFVSNHVKVDHQILEFCHSGKSVSTINVCNIKVLKTRKNLRGMYHLFNAGVDSVTNKLLYVLYFSASNGEPEYYLFYNAKGQLVFSWWVTRKEEKIHIYSTSLTRKEVEKYLKAERKITFFDAF